jgi:simple sugar transport system ATP-binding protein
VAGPSDELVKTVELTKTYPDGTRALTGVNFSIARGEIHGLLGENGAGKTTLSKILSGILRPTSGEINIKGELVRMRRPSDALSLGVGMVHQHFALVRPFSAFENIVLGTDINPTGRNAEAAKYEITELAKSVGLQVSLESPVETLALGAQQRVEILKMLYRKVDLLILDEPTSSLTLMETDELFRALVRLKEEGKGVIFITHKLKEVMDVCDTITVLRQGIVTGRISKTEATPTALANMMVGRSIELELKKAPAIPQEEVLTINNLTVTDKLGKDLVKDITLRVRGGEIFGIAGVDGNGQTELAEAICGVRRIKRGSVRVRGVEVGSKSPSVIRKQGVGLIPEDRRQMGLILEMNLQENTILGKQRETKFRGAASSIAWRKVRAFALGLIKKFDIATQGPEAPAKSLSGGNQQKVVISRELSSDPEFILAAQPTRGLDVAATEYIRKLLLDARGAGRAVLLISADLDEVIQLSDEIAVMYEGRLIGTGRAEQMGREKIGLLMGGVMV